MSTGWVDGLVSLFIRQRSASLTIEENADIDAMLKGVNTAFPVQRGQMQLGTWQDILVMENRAQAHRRDAGTALCGDVKHLTLL